MDRRPFLRAPLAVALVAGTVLAWLAPLNAAPGDNRCEVLDKRLICDVQVGDPGGTPGPASGAPGGSHQATGAGGTAVWTTSPTAMGSGPRLVTTSCQDGGQEGRLYRDTLRDAATGEVLETATRCVIPGQPAVSVAQPQAPPTPPSQQELLDATAIPELQIVANPSGRGLTGLESWFWAVDPGVITAQASLRGWTVSGTLQPGNWTWQTGDGGQYQSAGPGSEALPAIRHVYETKGTWPVQVEVSWSGSYTVSGWGLTYTVPGLVTEGTTTRDYQVIEARAVLDEPGHGG